MGPACVPLSSKSAIVGGNGEPVFIEIIVPQDIENSVIDICRYLLGFPGFCVPEQRIEQQHSVTAATEIVFQETVYFWEADRSEEKGWGLNNSAAQRMETILGYRLVISESSV